jgi:hypothetical protein
MAGAHYAVDIDSIDTLCAQWRQGADTAAIVDQALARACSRLDGIASDPQTPTSGPSALALSAETIALLGRARAEAAELAAALNADIAKLAGCAANYRRTEEQITANLQAVGRSRSGPTKTEPPPRHVGHGSGSGRGKGGGEHKPGGSRHHAPPAHYASRAQVVAWIDRAFKVLEAAGIPADKLDLPGVLTIIEHESSGNPGAINLWDGNAKAGHPSKGLMQTIDSTFNAYKLPGHDDIYDPVDNIIAGVRYAISRYGSISKVPGIKAVHHGGRYIGY